MSLVFGAEGAAQRVCHISPVSLQGDTDLWGYSDFPQEEQRFHFIFQCSPGVLGG